MIIDYDMTYIIRPITNHGSSGINQSGISGAVFTFTDALPYMLRGSYFEADKTIIINNLRLHHTFSIEIWAMWPDTNGTHTIFSKARVTSG